jgi:hypothetical protein
MFHTHHFVFKSEPEQVKELLKDTDLKDWTFYVRRFGLSVLTLQLLPPLGQGLLRDLDDDGS